MLPSPFSEPRPSSGSVRDETASWLLHRLPTSYLSGFPTRGDLRPFPTPPQRRNNPCAPEPEQRVEPLLCKLPTSGNQLPSNLRPSSEDPAGYNPDKATSQHGPGGSMRKTWRLLPHDPQAVRHLASQLGHPD